jgi:hypothetical protein
MTKVTKVNKQSKQKNKYASCQRMLIEEPSFFDVTTICAASSSSTSTTMTLKSSSSGLSASSQTCQMCYAQNPTCSSGAATAGISVVSFSVDSQGEADSLI